MFVTDRPRFDPVGYGDFAFTFHANGELVMMEDGVASKALDLHVKPAEGQQGAH